jgi:hypothetical protein
LDPTAFHHYECQHGGVLSQLSMVRMTPLMAERLRLYAAAKGCDRSVVIRCAIHDLLLHEGIDAYSAAPQPEPLTS